MLKPQRALSMILSKSRTISQISQQRKLKKTSISSNKYEQLGKDYKAFQ